MSATLRQTTFSAAVTANQKTIKFASLSGVAAGMVVASEGETMLLNEVLDSTNGVASVQRGYNGTKAKPHASGIVAYIDAPAYFYGESDVPEGKADAADFAALPIVVNEGPHAGRVFGIQSAEFVEIDHAYGGSYGYRTRRLRKRVTIAEVNAGVELLPAVVGFGYRMVECTIISVGGAAAAVTTVDILGTQTTSKKLAAYAQANLTQSTRLTAGGTGGTILADGASFVKNDDNTAITAGKTGSDVTTATHFDIDMTYTLE